MRTNKFFIAAAVALLLWGCDVKDSIYETAHPGKGEVTVTTNWSGIGQGITKPSKWTVLAGNCEGTAENADSHTFAQPFDPGNYTVYAWNPAEQFTFSGTTATVAPDGSGIQARPGWLFTAQLGVTVEADKKHTFTLPMAQQVRQLTLIVELTGNTADKVESITATLSGVAASYDMESGAHSTPSDVALAFAKGTDGKWTATVRLLGVTGSEQKLSGTLAFTGGSPENMPLESDLTTALSDFNANKPEPKMLDGVVAETPSPTGFTGTINSWKTVTGTPGIAD